MCQISVIMPIYNSVKYLHESIESVINQTYKDWELLAINEFGSNDGSATLIEKYAKQDKRIHLIQNEEKLGLAESLNKGFRMALGKYLARLDADDLAHPTRFEKQLKFMEENPNIGICGTYQHHFGKETEWIHKTPITPEECKTSLLFGCDICHSTLMLRRDIVIQYHLFYDNQYLAEDYELWTRAVAVTDFANIPEVLGEYRIGEDNITNAKKEKLNIESGRIVANNLKNNLNYVLPKDKYFYFYGWENPFQTLYKEDREIALQEFEKILKEILNQNKEIKFYNQKNLLSVIAAKWRWAKYGEEWNQKCDVANENEIFNEKYRNSFLYKFKLFMKYNPTIGMKIKVVIRILFRPFSRILDKRVERLENYIEWKTWDRYQRQKKDNEILYKNLVQEQDSMKKELITYIDKEQQKWKQYICEQYNISQKNSLSFIEEIVDDNKNSLFKVIEEIVETRQKINQTIDTRIWKAEQEINQTTDARIWKAEQEINQTTDARIWKAEQEINQTTDARIWKAEQEINQTTDARIWKAEQEINQITDARIWKAEQGVNQTTDARIWKMEQNIGELIEKKVCEERYKIEEKIEGGLQRAEQEITNTTDARVWKAEQNIMNMQELLAELLLEFQKSGKKVVLINTPSHDNLGDHAIAYAEVAWIKDRMGCNVIDITGDIYRQYHTVIHRFIKEDDIIAISGGGYIGSLWEYEEKLVEEVIVEYPNHAIRIFPQSIYFSTDREGKQALAKAQDIFQRHNDLYIFAREEQSYLFLKENFPMCKINLAMDMALYLYKQRDSFYSKVQNRKGIAICLKNDKESIFSEQEKEKISKITKKLGEKLIFTDTVTRYPIDKWQRFGELNRKLTEFAGYRLVITDRLHGVLFSILTQTPCIIWKGVSYKNKGIYEILSKYIKLYYVEDFESFKKTLENGIPIWEIIDQQGLENQIEQGLEYLAELF